MGGCCLSKTSAGGGNRVARKNRDASHVHAPPVESPFPRATSLSSSSLRRNHNTTTAGDGGTGKEEAWVVIPLPAAPNTNTNVENTPIQTKPREHEGDNPESPVDAVAESHVAHAQEKEKRQKAEEEEDGELYSIPEASSGSENKFVTAPTTSAAVNTPVTKETEECQKIDSAFVNARYDDSSDSSVCSESGEEQHGSDRNTGVPITTTGTVSTYVEHPPERQDGGNNLSIIYTHADKAVKDEKEKESESPMSLVAAPAKAVQVTCEESPMSLIREASLGNTVPTVDHAASESIDEKKEEGVAEMRTPIETVDDTNADNALADIVRQSVQREQVHQGESPIKNPGNSAELRSGGNVIQLDTLFSDSDDEKNNEVADPNEDVNWDAKGDSSFQSDVVPGGKVEEFDDDDAVAAQEPKIMQIWGDDDEVDEADEDEAEAGVREGRIQEYIDSGSSDGGSERRRLTSIVRRPALQREHEQRRDPEGEMKGLVPQVGEVGEVQTAFPPSQRATMVDDTKEAVQVEHRNHSRYSNNDFSEDESANDVEDDSKADELDSLLEKRHVLGDGVIMPARTRPVMILSPPHATLQSREGKAEDNNAIQ